MPQLEFYLSNFPCYCIGFLYAQNIDLKLWHVKLILQYLAVAVRCVLVAGAVPACSGPGEAYVLRCILHAQPDMDALPVLKRVHEAMGDHRAYLVLIERCLKTGTAGTKHCSCRPLVM